MQTNNTLHQEKEENQIEFFARPGVLSGDPD